MNTDNRKKLLTNENYIEELEELYDRKYRSLRIIKNLSEFLKVLSIKEGDILKSMLIKFACEAIEASRGSLVLRDETDNSLYYHDTVVFKDNRPVFKNYNKDLHTITFDDSHGHLGKTVSDKSLVLIPDTKECEFYDKRVDDIIEMEVNSAICVPIIVDGQVIGILELVNEKGKRNFDNVDIEAIAIIANLAMATMENAKLFLWAISDGLTKLYNIHFFKRSLDFEVKKINRYGGILSLIMLDIDKFKLVNDTYGHQIGDKVIVALSDILQTNVRQDLDIPGRYGGDEFIVMLPNTNLEGAMSVASRMLDLIRKTDVPVNKKEKINFTSSLGVAEYIKGKTMDELINAVDRALYKSKKAGRNTISKIKTY